MSVPTTRRSRIEISAEDRRLMIWLSRWRYATVPQMARWAGVSQQAMYRRCQRLVAAGLAKQYRLVVGFHAAWTLTPAAYTYIGSTYTATPPRLTTIEHGLGVVDVAGVAYSRLYSTVWSEREIASALHQKTKNRPKRGILPASPVPTGPWTVLPYGGTHVPDAVVVDDAGRWHSLEIEISPKAVESRLVAILRSFFETAAGPGSTTPRFASVTYYGSPSLVRKVEDIAARLMAFYAPHTVCVIQAFVYRPEHSTPVPPQPKR